MKRCKFPTTDKKFFITLERGPYPETHCHEHWEFSIITEGTFLHKIGKYERIVNKNTLLVIRPNDTHSLNLINNESFEHINIRVRTEALQSILRLLSPDLYDFLQKGDFVEYDISPSATAYFVNTFNKAQTTIHDEQATDSFFAMMFISVIRELLLCVNTSKQKKNYSNTVKEFIERMRKPENSTLSIEDIIKNMNYSHCHLIRLFKKETGTTPSQYFLKIKLNYARSLLESTDLSVLDIASTVGFSSLGHFTEVFKKQYSLPPANYRRTWNNYYNSFEEVSDTNDKNHDMSNIRDSEL